MVSRNTTIDLMRLAGILLIILAHVNPPNVLFQIRTFDVPMMVFVSGMSYYYSGKTNVRIVPYILSRFKRLVLPVWVFFSLFFSFIYAFGVTSFTNDLTIKTIILTFMLSGFGYVWIIKVFLLVALLSPLLTLLANRVSGYFISILAFFFLMISLLISKLIPHPTPFIIYFLINDIIIPCISYGSVFILGYKALSLSKKQIYFSIAMFSTIFIAYIACNYFQYGRIDMPQSYKYPPTLYYVAFSLIMTFTVFMIIKSLKIGKINPLFEFASSNTIWIYLWHIPVVEFFKRNDSNTNFIIKYLSAIVIASTIVCIQTLIVNKIVWSKKKSIIKTVFTG